MENNQGPWAKLIHWISEKPELERWFRLISPVFLYSALDERLSFKEAVSKALNHRLPSYSGKRTMCLGGIALLLFVNQIITGVLLAIYYKPSIESAYSSVQYIEQQVPLGFLVRQLHTWGGTLMMIFVLLHMIKVFYNKAYRPPRELTWISGVLLLFIVITFAFTGSLLPWSQSSYWGSMFGTELIGKFPILGNYHLSLLYGGKQITELTMSRFFAVHGIILPWITTALLIIHFTIIRRLGISEPL